MNSETMEYGASAIDLWVLHLRDIAPRHWSLLESALSNEEQLLAQTKKNHEIYIASRALTRLVLARNLQVTSRSLRFDKQPQGKPFLRDFPSLSFNLSHSKDFVVFALGEPVLIGVDVEHHKPRNYSSIAQHYFHPLEIEQLQTVETNPTALQNLFFHYWTLKEAFFKGLGSGIVTGLHTANFSSYGATGKVELDERLNQDNNDWQFYSEQFTRQEQNYSLALAAKTKEKLTVNKHDHIELLLQS